MSGKDKNKPDHGAPGKDHGIPRDEKEPTETVDTEQKPGMASASTGETGEAKTDIGTDMTQKVKQLEEENADLKDKVLRKYAEFENFRKRMTKEKEDSIRYANSMLLLDLATVIDNFERALKSAEDSKDFTTFHSGVALIEKQMTGMLETKYGLSRFQAKDQSFDPERHEAIMSEETSAVSVPTVIEDYQSGYTLHGRILRPAKVKVGQPAAGTPGADGSGKQ